MIKQEEMIGGIIVAEKNNGEGQGKPGTPGINAIHKGSKVTGNIVITQDLQITGDIEGNITGENNANIFVKGSCKGNIKTTGGSAEIDGAMSGGDIVAGGYVKVSGKFNGGRIQARERICINGEFTGILESNEVEIGSGAQGKGEIFYRETLCIQKGAKFEGKVTRIEAERKNETVQKTEQKQIDPKQEVKPKKGFFS